MRTRFVALILLILGAVLLPPTAGGQQTMEDTPMRERPDVRFPELQFQKLRKWTIFGRVMTVDGTSVSAAKVRIDLGLSQRPQTLRTDLRGQFTTDFSLDAQLASKLQVQVLATKPGFRDAWETAEFEVQSGTRETILVLREPSQDFDALPQSILVESLAPRLRDRGAEGLRAASARKNYTQGVREFLDRRRARRAVPFVAKVTSLEPGCTDCRTLLSLALLDAGSWMSAIRQLDESVKLESAKTPTASRPEPLFILGVVESWRHEPQQAAGYFLKALEVQPSDPLVLQELGRALVLQERWASAEHYLKQATQQGAGPEARLLRARALLETGDEEAPEAAQAELKTLLAGRRPKDLSPRLRPVFLELQARLQLKSYGETKSLVSQSFEELSGAVPELKGLELASSQEGLPELLQRVGKSVEAFFRDFPNTISHEDIRAERLDRKGKVLISQDQRFNYLFMAHAEKAGLGLDEYRYSSTPRGVTHSKQTWFSR